MMLPLIPWSSRVRTEVFCHAYLLLEKNFFSKKKFPDMTGNCTQSKNWSEALMEKCALLPWKMNSEKNSFVPSPKFLHWKWIWKKFFSRIKEPALIWYWMNEIKKEEWRMECKGTLRMNVRSLLAAWECADACNVGRENSSLPFSPVFAYSCNCAIVWYCLFSWQYPIQSRNLLELNKTL